MEMDRIRNLMGLPGGMVKDQPLTQLLEDPQANRKFEYDFAKTRLALADKGVIHNDLNLYNAGRRSDHIGYDPVSGKMQIIDYGVTKIYDHAANLHSHNNNLNLQKETYEKKTPGEKVKHFLDHKLDAIVDGMYAVGNKEEADIFKGLYKETVQKDLNQANDLINQGQGIINRHSREDTDQQRKYMNGYDFLKTKVNGGKRK